MFPYSRHILYTYSLNKDLKLISNRFILLLSFFVLFFFDPNISGIRMGVNFCSKKIMLTVYSWFSWHHYLRNLLWIFQTSYSAESHIWGWIYEFFSFPKTRNYPIRKNGAWPINHHQQSYCLHCHLKSPIKLSCKHGWKHYPRGTFSLLFFTWANADDSITLAIGCRSILIRDSIWLASLYTCPKLNG